MIVILQIANATWNEKKQVREVTYDDFPVQIDTSLRAHMKWEREFEPTMNCTLVEYYDRVHEWIKNEATAKAKFLSLVKLLYCYVSSEKLPTFDDFMSLFEPETRSYNLEKIRVVIVAVGKIVPKN
ncbi:MAG: hypothetical protein A2Y16_05380 [Tenericutes bacterium GWF2_57_13]|nr:MAG: hypothetical protein A2Y16_05380 [Tenericutes bacterium GWF2_57_13]